MTKLISIVNPCFNEEKNVVEMVRQVREVFSELKQYDYEQIFIDNCSTDNTVDILKEIAAKDKKVKVIINSRNFGHIRSPFYGLLQAKGDAVMLMASDFQDPPNLIPQFIKKWEEGYKMVLGVKDKSQEFPLMFIIRKAYYSILRKLADINLVNNFTGFGLYDKKIIDILKNINDPYPYFRGLLSELGFEKAIIKFTQPVRKRGLSKNNFYTLYDIGMLGLTSNSKIPLRLATFIGFFASFISFIIGLGYFGYKIIFWNNFSLGIAPIVVGFFLFMSLILFFLGILGEYICFIHMYTLARPLVIEKERINFE